MIFVRSRNTKVSGHSGLREEVELAMLETKSIEVKAKWDKRFLETETLINSFGMSPEQKRQFLIELAKRLGVVR